MAQAKTTVRHLQDVLASESRENREVDVNEGTGKRGPRRKPSKRPGLNSMLSRFSNHQAPSDRTCSGPSEPLEDWQEVSYRGESPAPEVPNSAEPGKNASRSQPEADMDSLDAAVQSLFHQAGVATVPDSQDALPVLVFTPANLPQSLSDPQKVLSRLAYKLEPFVQDAYIAVVLSSPPSASLSSSLLVSAYLNLPRPARKNVKKIYVVHPGFWSKMLVRSWTVPAVPYGLAEAIGSTDQALSQRYSQWKSREAAKGADYRVTLCFGTSGRHQEHAHSTSCASTQSQDRIQHIITC